MKRLPLFTILLTFIAAGNQLHAQIDAKMNLDFEKKMQSWLVENHVPAAGVGIIEDGKIKYIKVFGEIQKGVPAPVNSIFNIASMTKPVVAMLTLKLVQAGQWDLDEPLFHFWIDPDIANDPLHKKLTTRHVLTHQTGFVNWRIQNPNKKLSFNFEPGTKYQYSGEGFEYLRKALQNKFHKPLEQLLDSILFTPLGMKDTQYWNKDVDMQRYAHWHDAQGNEYKTSYQTGVNAADHLLTTIEDYSKFMVYVMNGAELPPSLYNDMIRSQVNVKQHMSRGLGWEIVSDLPNGEYSIQHGGSDPGIKSMGIILPKSKRGVLVFTNGDNGMFVYNNVIKESLDLGSTLLDYSSGSGAHKTITLSDETLKRYTGSYLDSYGRNLTIAKEDSTLKFSGTGLPTVRLFSETEKKFFIKEFDVQFEFKADDSLIVITNGRIDWTAKKIKYAPIVKLSADILEKYVGAYSRSDNKGNLTITRESDSLKLSGDSVPIMILCPTGETTFFAKGLGFQFEFIADDLHKTLKMNISGNGKLLCDAKKIK